MAFQLTNIVRDFKEDLEIGRCYIPDVKTKKVWYKKKIYKFGKNKQNSRSSAGNFEEMLMIFLKKQMNYQ